VTSYFAPAVYLLCFLASSCCAVLLGRTFVARRAPLLLWSTLCFTLLAANNLMLVLDLVVFVEGDLRLIRSLLSVGAIGTLIFGFIWSAEDD
jgi:hypothetical protein